MVKALHRQSDRAPYFARPEGEPVVPRARHIQYLHVDSGGGITDRLRLFTWLLQLGMLHNATTHIAGGPLGARMFLNRKHSGNISLDWSRYFDTQANHGDPWHPLENFVGCSTIGNPNAALSRLFEDGALCVNLRVTYYAVRDKSHGDPLTQIPPSPAVREAASRFLARSAVSGPYGALHVRRCDRLGMNAGCTDPRAVRAALEPLPEPSWLVFLYAEPGYRAALEAELRPLGRRLVFEDGLDAGGDNYLAYLAVQQLQREAAVAVETHTCRGAPAPQVLRPGRLSLLQAGLEAGLKAGAECGG